MSLTPIFQKLYPENSYQGQCFSFAHKLVKADSHFPLLPALERSKYQELLRSGIPINKLESFKLGDVLLLDYPIFGHGAVINNIVGENLQLTESNYQLNGRVHHTRLVSIHDKAIQGIWRGTPLYPVPQDPAYNIPLRVMVVMNNQPDWKSLTQHAYNFISWIYKASGAHILPVVDWKYTNLSNWETVFTGPVLGGANVEIIKEEWFNQNVLPLAQGFDVVFFVMKRSDWKGTVFDRPDQIELGYAYEKVNDTNLPFKAMLVADETDDYPPYFPSPLSAFAKLMGHELNHLLYGACGNSNVVPGGDYCHNHWFGVNNTPVNPDDCFKDYDYAKLKQLLNK